MRNNERNNHQLNSNVWYAVTEVRKIARPSSLSNNMGFIICGAFTRLALKDSGNVQGVFYCKVLLSRGHGFVGRDGGNCRVL